MSPVIWQDYLTQFVRTYRNLIDGLPPTLKEILQHPYRRRFLKPCQIEVMKFGVTKALVWTSTNNEDRRDMEFIVHEKPKNPQEFMDDFLKRNPELEEMRGKIYSALFDENYNPHVKYALFTPHYTVTSVSSPDTLEPEVYASEEFDSHARLIRDIYAEEQHKIIENASQKLRKDIGRIPKGEARAKLEERVNSIENALQNIGSVDKLDKELASLKGDISGLRTLVGKSEYFQDWRLLVSDVHRLKGEHVPREVFESKVRELSAKIEAFEKIEKAYERLSIQQEKVLEQQSSFVKWIKYSTILVPIAVACIPIIEIILRHFLGSP